MENLDQKKLDKDLSLTSVEPALNDKDIKEENNELENKATEEKETKAARLLRFRTILRYVRIVRSHMNTAVACMMDTKEGTLRDEHENSVLHWCEETRKELEILRKEIFNSVESLAGTEEEFNEQGSLFVGIKRKKPLQKDILQPPLKVYKDIHSILGNSTIYLYKEKSEKSAQSDVRIKDDSAPKRQLRFESIEKIAKDWTEKHMSEQTPAGAVLSSNNRFNLYVLLDVVISSTLKCVLYIKDEPSIPRRCILKWNFYSADEITKDFDDSQVGVFRNLTNLSSNFLPYPPNMPKSARLNHEDPLPYALDYIHSFRNIFDEKCYGCKKLMTYSPIKEYGFSPPFLRVFRRDIGDYLAYHPWCRQRQP